jgi:SAM-dependent methyltransferase
MTKINLGCGSDVRPDWLNIDISESVNPDVCHDLNETPWPIDSDSATHLEARHVLEHLDSPTDAFAEIRRILQPGGTLLWVYPIGHTRFEDTTHKQFWNYNSGEFQAGMRGDHTHEVSDQWRVQESECEWHISEPEPLVMLYAKYREWLCGAGPWLEQIPGLAGEMRITMEYNL